MHANTVSSGNLSGTDAFEYPALQRWLVIKKRNINLSSFFFSLLIPFFQTLIPFSSVPLSPFFFIALDFFSCEGQNFEIENK